MSAGIPDPREVAAAYSAKNTPPPASQGRPLPMHGRRNRTIMTPPLDTASSNTESPDTSGLDVAPPGTDAGALLRLAEHEATARRVGICEHQLLLSGTRLVVEADTGRVIDRLDTDPTGDTDDPGTP